MYESGSSTPNDEIKLKICEHFDISLDYLMGKSNIKNIIPDDELEKLIMQSDIDNNEIKNVDDFCTPTFGERLKELRLENNLTQEELANEFGLHKTRISQYELNKRQADDNMKKNLANYFNVSLDYIMGNSNIRNFTPTEYFKKLIIQPNINDNEIKKENSFFMITLGERIKKLRLEKRLSQDQLAYIFNISQQAVSNYEKGLREMDYKLITSMSSFFQVSTDYLLGISDIKSFTSDDELKRLIMQSNINDTDNDIRSSLISMKEKLSNSNEIFVDGNTLSDSHKNMLLSAINVILESYVNK